jgi:outer membrane biogenesis lipoprotein LolB
MKSRHQLYLLIPAAALLTACSATPPQYVMEPDYDYIQKVETSSKYSTHAAKIYWVNPPMKRQVAAENPQD